MTKSFALQSFLGLLSLLFFCSSSAILAAETQTDNNEDHGLPPDQPTGSEIPEEVQSQPKALATMSGMPQGSLAESPKTLTLSGGVDHAEEMEPISPTLQAGSRFDERSVSNISSQDYWYQIPLWLAGTWQRDEQNVLQNKPLTLSGKLANSLYPTKMGLFKSQAQFGWGHQFDIRGMVWNYVKFPYVTRVEGTTTFTLQFVKSAIPVSVSDKAIVIKFISTSHDIDRQTGVIVRADQAESISTYRPVDFGTLYARFSRKVFDSRGKPTSIQVSESYIRRINTFHPVNFMEGKDLRVSLSRFIQALYEKHISSMQSPR